MYTLYKFHFLNGISEINQLFDDILIIWPAPVKLQFLQTCYHEETNSPISRIGPRVHFQLIFIFARTIPSKYNYIL